MTLANFFNMEKTDNKRIVLVEQHIDRLIIYKYIYTGIYILRVEPFKYFLLSHYNENGIKNNKK